jgi:hypothetical protein
MHGVMKGVAYCNQERLNQLNNRIYDRNIPSQQLQMVFDPRSVDTRRSVFPALDCRTPSNVPIIHQQTFDIRKQFNPGSNAPFSGYANYIDEDSRVKDMFMARQKWNAQSKYIPSSKSDLFVERPITNSNPVQQTHPMLFKEENFAPFNPNPCNMGYELLYNHTRQQVKNLK